MLMEPHHVPLARSDNVAFLYGVDALVLLHAVIFHKLQLFKQIMHLYNNPIDASLFSPLLPFLFIHP